MPEFYLADPEYKPPSIRRLKRDWWSTVPDPHVAKLIATEHQYLHFHIYLLDNLHFRGEKLRGRLSYSLRAGAVKSAQLLCASILEAALRCHAEHRGYPPLTKPIDGPRPFGQIVEAWRGQGWPELEHVKDDIEWFKDLRDNIHLFRSKRDRRDSRTLLDEEAQLKPAGHRAVRAVSRLHIHPAL